MKASKKAVFFVLAIAFGFIITIGFRQEVTTNKKYDFQLFESNSRSLPDSIKYHYLGMEKCATKCHNNDTMGFQYNIVKAGPHAMAFTALSSSKAKRYAKSSGVTGNLQESLTCLKCHVTGAGLDSTFLTSTYRKDDGVTCESCHKGEFTPKTYLPKESDCLKCHNSSAHKVDKFDFKKDCARIAHPRPKPKKVAI
jgi:hypothetical protein